MSFCPKDFSKAFPYGRFNTSQSNFKLYPRLNPATNILAEDLNSRQKCNGGDPGTCISNQPESKHTTLFQNTTYNMTQKEQIAFFSKMGGRIR